MRLTLGTLALALTLTACGGGDEEASGGDTGTSTPECADVWVAGETLPEDYEGCNDGDVLVPALTYDCEDGRRLTMFDPNLFAYFGEEIVEDDDEQTAYNAAFDECKNL